MKTTYLVIEKGNEKSFKKLAEAKIVAEANHTAVWRDNGSGELTLAWASK